jgi:hypothetical protein
MRNPIVVSPKRIIITALISGTSLAAAACGSAAAHSVPAVHAAAPTPAAAATTAPPAPPAPLGCSVHASRHAVAGTLTGARVRTAPHALIVVTVHYASRVKKEDARASARGRHTFSYPAGRGRRVVVGIHASLHGRTGVCQTSFRAQQPPPPPPPMMVPVPAPTMGASTPMQPMM